jgi:predicted DCC family thiol-disulfide oxidoreductase YuxK
VLIYDGDCGFCKRSLGWAINLGITCEHQPWQSLDLADLGLTESDVLEAAWFLDHEGRLWRGHLGIARALRTSTHLPVRILGTVLGSRAISPAGRGTYRWIANHRYQLPGGTPNCKLG